MRNFLQFASDNNTEKMGQTVTLLGASGLIGSHLLHYLLEEESFSTVRILVRKSLAIKDPKLEELIIDFSDTKMIEGGIAGSEYVFCAIGTTNKKVKGDKEAYRRIDFDIPVHTAEACARQAVYGFFMVSSVGANPDNNNNFYIKLKGITEEAVAKQMIPQLHIFRPSLLLGKRGEKRFGESMMQAVAPAFSLFMAGSLRKYKPIEAKTVARAMLEASKNPSKGIFIHEYDSIKKLADQD